MAFTTYADLQTDIANWAARSDLTANIPDFIILFEAAACRRMKVRLQQATTTLTPSGGSVALPIDYLGWIRLTWTGSPKRDLEYVHPSYLQEHYPDSPSANPNTFTIEGSTITVAPSDDTALQFVYNQKTPAISATLNWLWTNHPDAYLTGSMFELSMFTKDMDAAQVWKARRDGIFDEIKMLDFRQAGGLAIRTEGRNP